jgi:excisionase family DNA binding protein
MSGPIRRLTSSTAEAVWTVQDVAEYLRVPVETVYQWRKRHYGPPASKVGRHLRYDPTIVRTWFREQAA